MKSHTYIIVMLTCVSFFSQASDQDQHKKTALIIGITGQDGAYLSEFLLQKGYEVHGVKRRASLISNTARIDHLYANSHFHLHYGDVTDAVNMFHLINAIRPDEVYNLAAQSHVHVSFELPEYTGRVDAMGVLHILEAIRSAGLASKTKFYQASTSELYGKVQEIPQKETTPFYPRSPYAVAKLYGFWITKNYREAYGMFSVNGILFNHESPIRGETFVTRKITRAVGSIKRGLQQTLHLGNLDSKRDWGHARDYVEAMWLMLQQEEPEDFVIATGQAHSVREFVERAFKEVNIDIEWVGSGLEERGIDASTGTTLVVVDSRYFRPAEVDFLLGDPSKAKKQLGWEPRVAFGDLVKEMMAAEMQNLNS